MVHKPVSSRITATPPHVTILLNNFKTLSLALLAVFLLFACKKDPVVEASPESGKVERTNGRNRVRVPSFDLLSSRSAGTVSTELAEWFEAVIAEEYPDSSAYVLDMIGAKWEVLDGPDAEQYIYDSPDGPVITVPVHHFLMGFPGVSRMHFQQQGAGILVTLSCLLPEEDYFSTTTDPDAYLDNFNGIIAFFQLFEGFQASVEYEDGTGNGFYLMPGAENATDHVIEDRCCNRHTLNPFTELDGPGGGSGGVGNGEDHNDMWHEDGTCMSCYFSGTCPHEPQHNCTGGGNGGTFVNLDDGSVPPWLSNHFNNGNASGTKGHIGWGGSGSGGGNDNNTNTGPTSTIYDETVFNIYRTALIGLGYGESEATQITDDCYHHLPNETAFYNCVDDHDGITNPEPEPTADEALGNSIDGFLNQHGLSLPTMTKPEIWAFKTRVLAKGCAPDEFTCFVKALFDIDISLAEAQGLIDDNLIKELYLLRKEMEVYTEEVQEIQNGIEILDSYLYQGDQQNPIGIPFGGAIPRTPGPEDPPGFPFWDDLVFGTDGDMNNLNPINRLNLPVATHQDIMFKLFRLMTIGNKDLRTVRDDYLDLFHENDDNTLNYYNELLSTTVMNSTNMKNWIRRYGLELNTQLSANDGDIDAVNAFTIARPRLNESNGFTILINDTQETNVFRLDSYNFDQQTGEWNCRFIINVKDHFGLDDNDVRDFQWHHAGFISWWMLQKIHAQAPFITDIWFVVQISGKI